MAIQMRRGAYSGFNPSSMVPGEFVYILSGDPNTDTGKAIYACFETGTAVRFGTYAEVVAYIAAQGYATGAELAVWKQGVIDDTSGYASAAADSAADAHADAVSIAASATQIQTNADNITALSGRVTTLEGKVHIGDQGTLIANNTNLNTLNTCGRYYSPSGTVTGTLTNKPSGLSVGFTMDVDRAGAIYRQTIYSGRSAGPAMWMRNGSSGSWSAWYAVTMTS